MSRKSSAKDQASLLPEGDAAPMKDVSPKKKKDTKVLPDEAVSASMPSVKPTRGARPAKALTAVNGAPPMPEGASILAMIADAAACPDFNPENMRALLDMQKEIMAEQQRRDFNTAFSAMQSKLPSIRQDGRIEVREKTASGQRDGRVQQSTPYATFNNMMKIIKPVLSSFGFSLWFATEPAGERLLVKGFLDHDTGGQRTTAFPLPAETSGSKNNVQGWGSSLSYGKRYATIALLNIVSHAPEDRDDDGHANPNLQKSRDGTLVDVDDEPVISAAQREELNGLIEWCGVGEDRFLEHYDIAKVADLPARLFGAASKSCRDYHANRQAKAKKNG